MNLLSPSLSTALNPQSNSGGFTDASEGDWTLSGSSVASGSVGGCK